MARSFKTWLRASGLAPKKMTPDGKLRLLAMYEAEEKPSEEEKKDAEIEAADDEDKGDEEEDAFMDEEEKKPVIAHRNNLKTFGRQLRAAFQLEAACKDHPEIGAQVFDDNGDIRAGWDLKRVRNEIELKNLRAGRETGPFIATGSGNVDRGLVIQAAIDQTTRLPGHEKEYSDQVLQAAHTKFRGQIGLQEMILEAAFANGYRGGVGSFKSDHAGVLRAAFGIQAAGFSTVSLPGLMSNTANKFLLKGFNTVEQVWQQITAKRSVNDFKTVTSYRMLDSMMFEKVGPAGEIKHGELSEESFTNQADTYGKMFAITRKDQINDDLGALTDVPRRIGRGAGLKLNDVFWTTFCDNSTFFADPSQHFYKGADSVLASAGLAKVLAKFRAKTEDGATTGNPLAIEPKILLIPQTLETTAMELMTSTNYNTGGSSSTDKVPNRNIWANKFTTLVSVYLENANYGNSAIIWYLLADPADIAVIETCFLKGKETPTVESAEADFNTLGIQMRGFFDFGVTKQDARGAVKSKGAA